MLLASQPASHSSAGAGAAMQSHSAAAAAASPHAAMEGQSSAAAAAAVPSVPLHFDFSLIQTEVEKRLVSMSYDFSKFVDGTDRGRPQHPQTLRAKQAIQHSMRAVDEILRGMVKALENYRRNPRAYANLPGWSVEEREQYAAYVAEMKGMLEHYAMVLQPRPRPMPQHTQTDMQQQQQTQPQPQPQQPQPKRAIPSIAHTLFPPAVGAAAAAVGAVGAGAAVSSDAGAAPPLSRASSPPISYLEGSAATAAATRAQFRRRSENVEYVSSAASSAHSSHPPASSFAHEPRSEAARACKQSMAAAAQAWTGEAAPSSLAHTYAASSSSASAARSASASPTPSPSTSLSHTRRRVLEANLRKQLAMVAPPPARATKVAAEASAAAADPTSGPSGAAVAPSAADSLSSRLDLLDSLCDVPPHELGCIGLHPPGSKLERLWIQMRRAMIRCIESCIEACCVPKDPEAATRAEAEAEAVQLEPI